MALAEVLNKYYPAFNHKDLTDEKIFKKVFPDEEFDYFKLKNLTSDVFGHGKDYLSFIFYRDHSSSKDKYLLEQLRDRSLDNIFEQTHKVISRKHGKSKIKDENYIQKSLELTEEMLFFRIPKDPDSRLGFFQDELDLFLQYTLIRLLRYYNIMMHEKNQNNCDFNMGLFNEVMNFLKENPQDNPTIKIYYNIVLLGKEKKDKYFYELKELKEKYSGKLNIEDNYTLFMHMANYCAYNFNVLEKPEFMREHFLLSKENFEKGTIQLGKLIYPDFLNHVKIAVRVDEFEWAEKYINEHQDQLTEEKENTLNFCYGYINYRKGDLDKALELFSRTSFPIFILKIQVKILLLKINYEKGFYEQVITMIDSFRHYLSRDNSLLEVSKESYYDFIKVLRELVKLRYMTDRDEMNISLQKIKDDIEDIKFNQFGIKIWLRERAGEIVVE
ncbi:MAG TPA: hypothetical protein PKA90_14915 [Ignavibacteria bacterium]|nr:hypothetical protein [Ignavibacteria bacterium]HMR41708.1 hypothetical protein [Ignavibacteria bacterium]